MGGAYNLLDAFGLNAVQWSLIGGILALVWRHARPLNRSHRIALLAAAALGITLRAYPIRPQLFSLLSFALLLTLLTRADDTRSVRPLVFVPLIMVLWVNLHGGWIVGLGVLAAWIAGKLVFSESRRVGCSGLVIALCLAVVATLANPYGIELWRFVAATVRAERPLIADWLPIYRLPPGLWVSWLVAVGMCVVALVSARQRLDRVLALVTLGLGLAALRVSRLDAFFALSAVFLLATALPRKQAEGDVPGGGSRVLGTVGLLAALVAVIVSVQRATRIEIRDELLPEPEAVAFFLENRMQGRLLTWFDWGEYAMWHLGRHGLKVSMDGRRETVYSDTRINEHLNFYFSSDDSGRYADALNADYAWLPVGLPAAKSMQSAGWHAVFGGPKSVILARQAAGLRVVTVAPRQTRRVFPGP
jgi:hypothetical protein